MGLWLKIASAQIAKEKRVSGSMYEAEPEKEVDPQEQEAYYTQEETGMPIDLEEDRERAANIINFLMKGLDGPREGGGEVSVRDELLDGIPEGVSIADIEGDTLEFLSELELWSYVRRGVPSMSLQDGPSAPVSLAVLGDRWGGGFFGSSVAPSAFAISSRELLFDLIYHIRDIISKKLLSENIEWLDGDKARVNFVSGATSFLQKRISYARLWGAKIAPYAGHAPLLSLARHLGGSRSQVPGCLFSVTTNTPSLSVYWSGAYYITPNFFGHPTSPVTGVLQAGTYVFGVGGGAYRNLAQWDTNAVCSLPGAPAAHLQY